jgi:hypothetical protein
MLTVMAPQLLLGAAPQAAAASAPGASEHQQQLQRVVAKLVRLLVAPPGSGLGARWGNEWQSVAQVSWARAWGCAGAMSGSRWRR